MQVKSGVFALQSASFRHVVKLTARLRICAETFFVQLSNRHPVEFSCTQTLAVFTFSVPRQKHVVRILEL